VAFYAAAMQTLCFETCAYHGTRNLRLQWLSALLRQDAAFFDVYNVNGMAAQVGAAANKYRRGTGRKFGEGVQFLTTGIGGIAYGLYSQYQVSLLIMALVPLVAATSMWVMNLNQTKSARSSASYATAGAIAYTAVSAIRTVLSLNAVPEFIRQYQLATNEAYQSSTQVLVRQGLANGTYRLLRCFLSFGSQLLLSFNSISHYSQYFSFTGSMLGTFIFEYCVLVLFGSFLIYRDVQDTGCDPSESIADNVSCDTSGTDVFAAMLAVAFAAEGISHFGNATEAFTVARVAAYSALQAIRRIPGAPSKTIYKTSQEIEADELAITNRSSRRSAATTGDKVESCESEMPKKFSNVRAILPAYEIDSSAVTGYKPSSVSGAITFKHVHFSYPTRPSECVLRDLCIDIRPGETVAFVGPSGSGKSTIVALLERFYDPLQGQIEIDGKNIRDWNVQRLRSVIGYVGQEPTLFASSIRQNILYGNPNATQQQIEEAARMANAHDFIMSFSDGYDTQVGDKGSQLSGGQKQVSC
jgi:ATP-binding cassette, subfamily B (MDR/TAP), member 1